MTKRVQHLALRVVNCLNATASFQSISRVFKLPCPFLRKTRHRLLKVVGDDLLTSNPKRVKRAVEEAAGNTLNLTGTVQNQAYSPCQNLANKFRVVITNEDNPCLTAKKLLFKQD